MANKKISIVYNAPVTLSFALISLISLALGLVTFGKSTNLIFSVYPSPLSDPLTYVRLFAHVLGHSSYSHYIGNMMYLLLLGPGLEEKYGSSRILSCILICAAATGLIQMFILRNGLLGASSIVFMFIVMSSFTSVKHGELPLTSILILVLFLGQEIVTGLTSFDNISQFTHIIGGLLGLVFGLTLRGKKG